MALVNSSDSNEANRFRDFVRYFRSAPLWQAALLFLFALHITAFVTYQTLLEVERVAEKNFEVAVNELQLKIEERLDIHKRLLLAGAAMFDASNFVDRNEWHTYAKRFHEDINSDGVQGLGVAVWLQEDRIAEHVKTMRMNGWPDYDLAPTLSNGGRSAVLYIEPFNGANAHQIGLDLYEEPVLRAAMEEARDSKRVVFSRRTLNGDMETHAPSIFMFMPVYNRESQADTLASRRQAIYGWIYSPIHIEAFLKNILGNWQNQKAAFIQTRVYDGDPSDGGTLLFSSALDEAKMQMDAFFLQKHISFGDHVWTLDFMRVKGPDSGIDYGKVWITLVAGAIVSGLLSLLMLTLLTTRSKAIAMADRLTASLRHSQDLLKIAGARAKVGGWILEVEGSKLYLSDEIRSILEMSPGQSLGLDHGLSLYTEESRTRISAALQCCIESGKPYAIDLELKTVKGRTLHAHVIGYAVVDEAGRTVRVEGAMQDITEQKQSALELQRLNRALRMLSLCNETLIRTSNEKQLLDDICKLAVEVGGYYMAWVGYAEHDATSSIVLKAHEGGPKDFFAELKLSWALENPGGYSTGARAIRSGVPVVVEDVLQVEEYPLQAQAEKYGYRGVMSLPLKYQQETFGFLALYSIDVRPVAEDELRLLQELAEDLAFGIVNLRAEAERKRIQLAVLKMAAGVSASTGSDFFMQLARNMADALGADAGFIARCSAENSARVRTIAAVVEGEAVGNFEYQLEGSPCETLNGIDYCMVASGLMEKFPGSPAYKYIAAEAYLGGRLIDSTGKISGFLFVLFRKPLDVTDLQVSTLRVFAARAAAELERQDGEQQLREQASLLDKAQDAIIVRDLADKIVYWNKSAERLYGWQAEEVIGQHMDAELFVDADAKQRALDAVLAIGEWVGEFHQQRKDGSDLIVESHRTLVRDDYGQPKSILVINTDITRRKEAERQIKQLAFYDELTQLPNRRLFLDTLKSLLLVPDRSWKSALLLIDLDNFKELNDTFGHDIGDQLLREVARRLSFCVRDTDTVARLGGDEFVVILDQLDTDQSNAVAQVQRVGDKILAAFADAFRFGGHEHRSTPSIGATLIEAGMSRVDELLKRADIAMYQAKMAGRNTMRFFDPDMQSAVARRVAMEEDIHLALQNEELLLYYQPQVDDTGMMTGAEVLVRWQHPQRGIIEPASFIPLAEDTGLIIPLGERVLRDACGQLVRWAHKPKFSNLTLAVNVSPRQFRHPDFVQQVLNILKNTGANPERLKLELTETVLIEDIDDVIAKVSELKAQGVSFALDDFGTGYSSLSYLKQLPFDQLKIDRSFVRDVLDDPDDAAIARTIITLGNSLGLTVMAEGVETEGQRNFLAENGCHFFQGYLFSPPVPVAQLEHFLRQHGIRA